MPRHHDARVARYEYSEGYTPDGILRGAHEFWEIEVAGTRVVLRYGRLGSKGRKTTKVYDTDDEARRAAMQMVARKEKKGYRYVEGSSPPPQAKYHPPPKASNPELLAQIHRRPNDPDAYLVYADFLQDAGDPLGELIALGHAMFLCTDRDIPRFLQLQQRREELLTMHQRHLFGDLAEYQHEVRLHWRLGLVDRATLTRAAPSGRPGPYDDALVQAVLTAPVCQALQGLRFEDPAANLSRVLAMVAELAPASLHALWLAPDHELPTDLPATRETALVLASDVESLAFDVTDFVRPLKSLRHLALGAGLSVKPLPQLRSLAVVAPKVPFTEPWPSLEALRIQLTTDAIPIRMLCEDCAHRMPRLTRIVIATRFDERVFELVDSPLVRQLRSLELVGPMPDGAERQLRSQLATADQLEEFVARAPE